MAAIPFPDIDPVALQLGPVAIRWYALAYLTGILLGWLYMMRLVRRWGAPVDNQQIGDFVLWATLGIVLGGRLGYVIFYNFGQYLENPLRMLAVWQGGMSFHGGLLGMAAAVWIYARRQRISVLALSDLVACAAPIGLLFGRLANFVNGELYGRVTDVPWAIVFPDGGPLGRHPSQIYEALLEGLLLLIVLGVLARRANVFQRPGLLTGYFFAGYGFARFFIEFVREPDAQLGFVIGSLSMGQILSVPLILAGAYLIARSWLLDHSRGGARGPSGGRG